MTGNTTHRFTNTAILAATSVDATEVVTSDALDERLGDTYARVGLRAGLLERLVGIRERRWWADGQTMHTICRLASTGDHFHAQGIHCDKSGKAVCTKQGFAHVTHSL